MEFWAPDKPPKIFSLLVAKFFKLFEFPCIPRILRIHTDSFCVFSVCIHIDSAWWLNGSAPDCCPAVPGSNPASPQPTADCQSFGGLSPGMTLGDRGEKIRNELLVRQNI